MRRMRAAYHYAINKAELIKLSYFLEISNLCNHVSLPQRTSQTGEVALIHDLLFLPISTVVSRVS